MASKLPIVIVDDDPDDRELLGEFTHELRPEHELRYFANGVDVLQYLETTEEQPFIILCDVNMPLMNGIELLEKIERSPFLKQKSIPFILLSTSGDKRYVLRAYELCVQGFFQKPSELAELKHILKLTYDFWAKCLHPHHPQVDPGR
jgi:CheY-like chemotaxis protein